MSFFCLRKLYWSNILFFILKQPKRAFRSGTPDCKYCIVLRDNATGAFKLLPVARRTTQALSEELAIWIKQMRSKPIFKHTPYDVVSVIKTDNERAWSMETSEWQEIMHEIGVEMLYVEPGRHAQENGYAEAAVKTVESVVKSILMSANLSPGYWQSAAADAEFLLNRFPVSSDSVAIPIDGDRVRPLEALTRGYYSRRQLDRELSYYVPTGTPCLVHDPKIGGSSLAPKVRWGIARGMYREQVIFMDPFSKSRFKSKSYAAYHLKEGLNWSRFLGRGDLETTRKSLALPEDTLESLGRNVILPKMKLDANKNIVFIDETQRHGEKGGSVDIFDDKGVKLLTDMDNGVLYYPQQQDEMDSKVTDGDKVPLPDDASPMSDPGSDSFYDRDAYKPFATTYKNKVDFEEELIKLGDGTAAINDNATAPNSVDEEELFKSHVKNAVQSGVGDTFSAILKRHPLKEEVPYNFRELYRTWLTEIFDDVTSKDLPKKGPISCGMRFPVPCGGRWRELVDNFENKHHRREDEAVDLRLVAEALHTVSTEQNHYLKAFRGDRMKQIIKTAHKKRKREKAVGTGKTPPPKGFTQAFFGPKAKEWVDSADKEIDGLTDEGVIGHGYTHKQLLEAGVEQDPNDPEKVVTIPLSIVLDHKYDEYGTLQRLKTRMALSGHPGNMQKGVHFKETFSASPNHCSARLLQALCAVKRWKRFANFDHNSLCRINDKGSRSLTLFSFIDMTLAGFPSILHRPTQERLYLQMSSQLRLLIPKDIGNFHPKGNP